MRPHPIPLLLAAALLLPTPGASQAPPRPDWRRDIAALDSAMKLVHPAPFHRATEAEHDAARDALLRDLPRLTDAQVVLRMMAWSALLHDAHSGLRPGAPAITDRLFPIRIDRFADGIHVVAAPRDSAHLLGARVLRIGPLLAQRAWDSLVTFTSGDNIFIRWASVPRLLSTADVIDALGWSATGRLPLILLSRGGDTLRIALTAVPGGSIDASGTRFAGWAGPAGHAALPIDVEPGAAPAEQHRELAYWYRVDGGTLYAQVNQVTNSADTVMLERQRAVVTLAGFSDSVMARIDRGGIDRLVLDLRYNGGGNNFLVRPFVAGVAARPIGTTRGRFFVITGRATYSAAMNFVSLLEDRTAAIFVGEPPGGAPNHYGDAVPITLPTSRQVLRVSTLNWNIGVGPRDIREVHEPDLPVAPRFADLAAGHDAALAAITGYRDGDLLSARLLAHYRNGGLPAATALLDSAQAASTVRGTVWESEMHQVLRFANGVIGNARSTADIFAAFSLLTDRYPNSAVAWAERARVHAFGNDWAAARSAYARALALRPANAPLRRWLAMAQRR